LDARRAFNIVIKSKPIDISTSPQELNKLTALLPGIITACRKFTFDKNNAKICAIGQF